MNSRSTTPTTTPDGALHSPWATARRVRVLALVLVAVLVTGPVLGAEGFDILRLITSQWVKPNVMLILDESGSMRYPVTENGMWMLAQYRFTQGGTSYRYNFLPVINHDYEEQSNFRGPFDDATRDFPGVGSGQGFWLLLDRMLDTNRQKIVEDATVYDFTRVSSSTLDIVDWNEPDWHTWDYIKIVSYPGRPDMEKLYQLRSYSSWNGNFLPAEVYLDGMAPSASPGFPALPAGEVGKVVRVRIGVNDLADLEVREAAVEGLWDRNYTQNIYVPADPGKDWREGDLVYITGFQSTSGYNGYYIITDGVDESSANIGMYYFKVAAFASDNTWYARDSTYTFSGNSNKRLTVQRVMPPSATLPEPVWFFVPPSRMAITKNVLGEHLTLWEPSSGLTPAGTESRHSYPYYTFSAGDDNPTTGAYYDWYYKIWRNWKPSFSSTEPAAETLVSDEIEPLDLVSDFSDVINWGMVSYSGACDSGPQLRVGINPDDDDQALTISTMEGHMRTVHDGGLQPGGSTPTRGALDLAFTTMLEGWTDNTGTHSSTWDQDQKTACGRTYGVILMTDGESNNCNPSNGSWGSCPSSWDSYPAGMSDKLWNGLVNGSLVTNVRTWMIGVSPAVGRCELNYTAYRGRSDASSPNEDAGFDYQNDARLPGGSPGTYDDTEDYAYFTNSAQDLKDAFAAILAGLGVGDYATSAPSVSDSGGATMGLIGFLASTDYPSWEGHLRAFDLTKAENDPNRKIWDAAEVLRYGADSSNPNPNNGVTRKIYTWNPASSNALVEITSGNIATLDTICNGCGITSEVVDFIRGNDGSGTARNLQLGSLVNSTPTVLGAPKTWEQEGQVEEHSTYESDYSTRRTLVWIGTSDGMIRAFDFADGAEMLALIPPDLLDNQPKLYANYAADPGGAPLGQPKLPQDHIYGVANSFRVADVWDDANSRYRTVMVIAEGPGGTGLHAIDVTHPYAGRTIAGNTIPPDPNFGYSGSDPVKVLWSVTGDGEAGTTALTDLGNTWSIPAIGATGSDTWRLHIGNGYRENADNSLQPRIYYLDPFTGEAANGTFAKSTAQLTNEATYWVGNQAFADSVLWQNDSKRFEADNLVNEGVHGDLNGTLWSFTADANTIAASSIVTLPDPDPLYYSAAVAAYPEENRAYALYAFSSGSFFETSENITGADVGLTDHFIPQIHVAVRNLSNDTVTHQAVDLQDLPKPGGGTLGRRTQVTSSPILFTPKTGATSPPFALYLLYDPDATACVGYSYVLRINFDPSDLTPLNNDLGNQVQVYEAGQGTAGGFAVAGEKVLFSQSATGSGNQAQLKEVPNLTIPVGGDQQSVTWWQELR